MKPNSIHTPEGKMLTELFLETFRMNGRLLIAGDNLTKDLGLTSARWQVLGAISASAIPLTVPSIARNMGLQRQSVQRIVDVFAEEGVVELADNPHHKRAKLVLMTSQGKSVLTHATGLQIPWVNHFAEGIDAADIKSAVYLLQKIRLRMEQV